MKFYFPKNFDKYFKELQEHYSSLKYKKGSNLKPVQFDFCYPSFSELPNKILQDK